MKVTVYTLSAYHVLLSTLFTFTKPFKSSPQISTAKYSDNYHFIEDEREPEMLSKVSKVTQPVWGEDWLLTQVLWLPLLQS